MASASSRPLGDGVTRMLDYSFAGSQMVFGELGKQHSSFGSIFAFQVLPTIIFISALFAVLYHIGVMQIVIKVLRVAHAVDDARLAARRA